MQVQCSVKAIRTLAVAICMLTPLHVQAGDIDTEHIFGFMIGSDIGRVGEREFQSETTGRFGKSGGRYNAGEQEFELEFVPAPNVRIEIGSSFAAYRIAGVPGLNDQRSFAWQGASVDFRYRFLDRETAPVGMTLALGTHASRIDETSAERVESFGTGLTLAFDREIVPDIAVAALNLIYQPEWTREVDTGKREREASIGVALGLMMRVTPTILLGAEARYMRRHDGIGLGELAGQALFVGPTAYVQLSEKSRLTASWSAQAWGRSDRPGATLDLVNFERHQARLIYGINF